MKKRRSIFFRITTLSWLLIVVTLVIFISSTIPYQKDILIERMNSEARDIAASISQVTATAIIAEDYSFALEHCLNVVQESNSIMYSIITKKDGFSLVILDDGWRLDSLKGKWIENNPVEGKGEFVFEPLLNEEVFHYQYPFSYSGIEWGWVHIGLSLKNYNSGTKELYLRTFTSLLVAIVIGFLASIFIARKISTPVHRLNEFTKAVAGGNLSVRSDIKTGDEIEGLSDSFNIMTEALAEAQTDLEKRVMERTAELAESNIALELENKERIKGEKLLQSSLHEKEVLLKEIHHRVKNNLQIISSLLYLQSKKFENEDVKNIFKDSQTRVKSMSLVHEKLYQSKTLSHIDFKEYIQNLTNYIFSSYTNNKKIRMAIEAEEIKLNIDTAVPCGLIINELVSNAMKYAFPENFKIEKPVIKVAIKRLDELKYSLIISDNGIGIPEDYDQRQSKSLGLQLVNSLVAQIEGDLKVISEKGIEYRIVFIDRNKVRTKQT
ncbi:MAG: HAMP domain-containing protein [Ignavibacteriales bacterium]|nr:HAMP domain-containing protein [Ignavibacteriota bacterium]MCB9248375.1 HAMP domain-containing protein [Ignavibacteriales bacterium]